VAAIALLEDGHQGQGYSLTGEQSLTQAERLAEIGAALGRELRFEEETPEDFRRRMTQVPAGVLDSQLQFLAGRVGIPAPTSQAVRQLTGHRARTYSEWVAAHRADFGATPA
jgi:hypothetical protein